MIMAITLDLVNVGYYGMDFWDEEKKHGGI
jgi:hypothetical protein